MGHRTNRLGCQGIGRLAYAFAVLLAGGSALAAEDAGQAKSRGPGEIWYGGRIDLRCAFRTTAGTGAESDQDLTQDLFLEAGRGATERVEVSGRVREDIDGHARQSLFRDIYDTYDRPSGFLHTAFGEVLDRGPLARVRAGRQYYAEAIDLRFDGGLVETKALGEAVKLSAYGGIPTHLYEASVRGDWLAGGAAEVVLIPRTSIRLDYVHLTDRREDLDGTLARVDGRLSSRNRDDDFFAATVTHRLTKALRLRGRASTFEGKSTRFEADGYFNDVDLALSAHARYVAQLGAYRDLSIQFTPLDEVLGEYAPYHEGYLDVRKGLFSDHLSLGSGLAFRELQDEKDEGPFNHEWKRAFVFVDVTDMPWVGLTLSTRIDQYADDDRDGSLQLSGDVSQTVGPVTIGAGTAYAQYKFDEFFLTERDEVRSYFANLEWRATKAIRARLAYSFEDDDEDEFHGVRCDLRIAF